MAKNRTTNNNKLHTPSKGQLKATKNKAVTVDQYMKVIIHQYRETLKFLADK